MGASNHSTAVCMTIEDDLERFAYACCTELGLYNFQAKYSAYISFPTCWQKRKARQEWVQHTEMPAVSPLLYAMWFFRNMPWALVCIVRQYCSEKAAHLWSDRLAAKKLSFTEGVKNCKATQVPPRRCYRNCIIVQIRIVYREKNAGYHCVPLLWDHWLMVPDIKSSCSLSPATKRSVLEWSTCEDAHEPQPISHDGL